MTIGFKGYSKSIIYETLPDGRISIKESFRYLPDADTEIFNKSDLPLRDLTEVELNEIMAELEKEKMTITDMYPLKGVREKVLNE